MLRRNLREVVATRYDKSMTQASIAAGLNQDMVRRVLASASYMPDLRTLKAFSETYGWPLCDVVYWALGLPEPGDLTPKEEVERGFRRMGLAGSVRESLLAIVQLAASNGTSQ